VIELETWRPVPGWEGLYEVSDIGRVRSRRRKGARGGILKMPRAARGFRLVGLSKANRLTSKYVHDLVAAAFHGEKPAGLTTRHMDGDVLNNLATNIAYGTAQESHEARLKRGTLGQDETGRWVGSATRTCR
jgi:hypothetical protein